MLTDVIECVVNFSVGKEKTIIDKIKSEIELKNQAKVVHIHSHIGAERSVFTVFASKKNIVNAIFRGMVKALELIDMRQYKGNHPAIGAVDIVPFVPIKNVSILDCQSLSRELAQKITQIIDIPVYLYGLKENSKNFDYPIKYRARGFNGLNDTLKLIKPDYGPVKPHTTAGAMLIGARNIMLAYNLTLDTKNLKIGKNIARNIRTSGYVKNNQRINGTLKACQAIAWFMKDFDRVQISCNLHDINKTNIVDVYCEVEKLASLFNIEIKASEIIGLAPVAAFNNNENKTLAEFMDYIKLDLKDFNPKTRIIENLI